MASQLRDELKGLLVLAGPLALARLDGQNALASAGGDGDQVVELGRDARPDVAAVLGDGRGVVT